MDPAKDQVLIYPQKEKTLNTAPDGPRQGADSPPNLIKIPPQMDPAKVLIHHRNTGGSTLRAMDAKASDAFSGDLRHHEPSKYQFNIEQ
jgi:hypothetical protein